MTNTETTYQPEMAKWFEGPKYYTCWGCEHEETCVADEACLTLKTGWLVTMESKTGTRYLHKVGEANAAFPNLAGEATYFVSEKAAQDFVRRLGLQTRVVVGRDFDPEYDPFGDDLYQEPEETTFDPAPSPYQPGYADDDREDMMDYPTCPLCDALLASPGAHCRCVEAGLG